jgi:pimeloyl-ACP methyl ester carboxylesterase
LSTVLRFESLSTLAIAAMMAGGDRSLGAAVRREVLNLADGVFVERIAAAFAATRAELLSYLGAPLLAIVGKSDRLLSPSAAVALVGEIPFAVSAAVDAPHLAAQIAPSEVWAAITEEFERAA